MSDDILCRDQSITADTFDGDDLTVTAETTVVVEGWDRLDPIQPVLTTDRELSIQSANADINWSQNVGDIARMLDAKQGA